MAVAAWLKKKGHAHRNQCLAWKPTTTHHHWRAKAKPWLINAA
jgi:hypothetical protein